MIVRRILTVGDLHDAANGPARRVDRYHESVGLKLDEVHRIAVERAVHYVLFTGDLTHHCGSHVPYGLTCELIDRFAMLRALGARPCIAMGNHDIQGNANQWSKHPIGAIARSGEVVPLWLEAAHEQVGHLKLVISGAAYRDDADLPSGRDAVYGVERDDETFSIHVVHAAYMPNGRPVPYARTTPADLEREVPIERRADVYVAGHVHDDLGVFGHGVNRTIGVNYGALTRGTIDERDLRREVAVGLLKLQVDSDTHTHSLRFERIPLRSVKPPEEVFDLAALAGERLRDQRVAELTTALQTGSLGERFALVDPYEAAEAVLASGEVSERVRADVRRYVALAKENLRC